MSPHLDPYSAIPAPPPRPLRPSRLAAVQLRQLCAPITLLLSSLPIIRRSLPPSGPRPRPRTTTHPYREPEPRLAPVIRPQLTEYEERRVRSARGTEGWVWVCRADCWPDEERDRHLQRGGSNRASRPKAQYGLGHAKSESGASRDKRPCASLTTRQQWRAIITLSVAVILHRSWRAHPCGPAPAHDQFDAPDHAR